MKTEKMQTSTLWYGLRSFRSKLLII